MDIAIDWTSPWDWFVLLYLFVVSPLVFYAVVIRHHDRSKPEGYIGKFRRTDGRIVHVMRMESGQLWVASEEKPGVMPVDLGYVDGREIMRWHKLSTTPDGQDSIARPQ